MEQEQLIKIDDESGDRKYFTIVPNYILNHSTAVAQALYLQLKRLGGERGIAYPGSRYLKEKLGISQPTLRKELKYLLEKGWIRENGDKEVITDGGRQKIKCYKIIDLWQLNNEFYLGGEKIEPPVPRGEKIDTQGVKSGGERIDTKEDLVNKIQSFKKNQETFELFYKSYPNKVNKKGAARSWSKIKPSEHESIFSALEVYKQSEQWSKDGGKFIPHPTTWLNQERWKDAAPPPAEKKATFQGNEMKRFDGKWKVKEKGQWLFFGGKEKDIIYK